MERRLPSSGGWLRGRRSTGLDGWCEADDAFGIGGVGPALGLEWGDVGQAWLDWTTLFEQSTPAPMPQTRAANPENNTPYGDRKDWAELRLGRRILAIRPSDVAEEPGRNGKIRPIPARVCEPFVPAEVQGRTSSPIGSASQHHEQYHGGLGDTLVGLTQGFPEQRPASSAGKNAGT